MNKSYSVYFPNTDLIQEIIAETWDIDNSMLLSFYQSRSMVSKKNDVVAVFNMNNILGFKENGAEVVEDGNAE